MNSEAQIIAECVERFAKCRTIAEEQRREWEGAARAADEAWEGARRRYEYHRREALRIAASSQRSPFEGPGAA